MHEDSFDCVHTSYAPISFHGQTFKTQAYFPFWILPFAPMIKRSSAYKRSTRNSFLSRFFKYTSCSEVHLMKSDWIRKLPILLLQVLGVCFVTYNDFFNLNTFSSWPLILNPDVFCIFAIWHHLRFIDLFHINKFLVSSWWFNTIKLILKVILLDSGALKLSLPFASEAFNYLFTIFVMSLVVSSQDIIWFFSITNFVKSSSIPILDMTFEPSHIGDIKLANVPFSFYHHRQTLSWAFVVSSIIFSKM